MTTPHLFEHGFRYSRHSDFEKYLVSLFDENFAQYRQRWNTVTMESAAPAPLDVSIELMDACNINCSFCFRHVSNEKATGEAMDLELVRNLLLEARTLGVDAVDLGGGGEPLIYPHITEMLALVREIGFTEFIIPTNGLRLTKELAAPILDTATRVHISIDAASEKTYRRVRGGDWSVLRRNIDAFLAARAKRGIRHPTLRVSFILMDENRHETDAFLEQWRDVADVVDFQKLIRYPSQLETLRQEDIPNFSCLDPFRMMLVRASGAIYPCCSFYNRRFPLGKFPDTSLRQAWHGEAITLLRHEIRSGSPCQACLNCKKRSE